MPVGVQPWSELGLSSLGEPLLQRLTTIVDPPDPSHPPYPPLTGQSLSGRDRAIVAATLLAGTLGNIQSAACLLLQFLLTDHDGLAERKRIQAMNYDNGELETALSSLMCKFPPVPVLPRRTREKKPVLLNGVTIPPDTDCLLLLEALPEKSCPQDVEQCPHIWGRVQGPPLRPSLPWP